MTKAKFRISHDASLYFKDIFKKLPFKSGDAVIITELRIDQVNATDVEVTLHLDKADERQLERILQSIQSTARRGTDCNTGRRRKGWAAAISRWLDVLGKQSART